MYIKPLAILLLLAVLCSADEIKASSQEKTTGPSNSRAGRRRIGLVLSGGGARGLAHIGVLEWLEQHRIPVDYIAGTSMGGLVGGLYATGMRPEEIRRLASTLDWDKLLSGPPSYNELSFRRKEDRRAYPTILEFGWRNGLRLPRAINPTHYVGLLLDRLTLPYSTVPSFDDLPIPFRCVATDMIAAQPVVLKDGSLAQALSATMAIPGIFTPVEIEGKVLADGGLLDNVPSDVVQAMGADLIIAVNVGTPLGTRKDLQTLPGILSQVIGVTTIGNERRGLQLADIVITPELNGYTSFDFKDRAVIEQRGYIAAALHAAELEALSLDERSWDQYLADRNTRRRATVPAPVGIVVTGVSEDRAEAIREKLEKDVGQPIDPDNLDRQLSDIRGTGRYESLRYDLVQLAGQPWLRIHVLEKPDGPPFIIPAVQIQSRGAADVTFSAGFRLTNYDVAGRNSELRLDTIVGSNNLFAAEYYRPFGDTGLFVAPRTFYSSDRTDIYQNTIRVAQYLVRQGGVAVDAGEIFGKNAQLRVGYELGLQNGQSNVGASTQVPNVEGTLSAASARFVYDGQNSVFAPTRGVRATASLFWYFRSPGAPEAYPQAEAGASSFHSIGSKGALFFYGAGGTSFNMQPGPIQQFTLGGPLRLSAYGLAQFRGSNYGLVAGGYRHQLGDLPTLLGGRIYGSVWYEGGSTFFLRTEAKYRDDVAGAVVLDTLLGPLTIGGAWGKGGTGKIFFSLGRFFWGQHNAGSQLEASYP
jgi:NTE family protein